MTITIRTEKFEPDELQGIKESTGAEDAEEAMKKWAENFYPIGSGAYRIGETRIQEDGTGEIQVIER